MEVEADDFGAPFVSAFGDANLYPTSVFKRKQPSRATRADTVAATPGKRNRQASPQSTRSMPAKDAPALLRGGGRTRSATADAVRGGLHSAAAIPVISITPASARFPRRSPSKEGENSAKKSEAKAELSDVWRTPARSASRTVHVSSRGEADGAQEGVTANGSKLHSPPSASRQALKSGRSSACTPKDGSAGLSSSSSPPVTPSANIDAAGGAPYHTQHTTLLHGGDASVCADAHCIHSRESIAEFIEVQRELRRCYAKMHEDEETIKELYSQLSYAQDTLRRKTAEHEVNMHEREKELLVELARVEHEWRSTSHSQTLAQVFTAATARTPVAVTNTSKNSAEEDCMDNADDDDGEDHERDPHRSSRRGPGARLSTRERQQLEAQQAAVDEMQCVITDLEDTLQEERRERQRVLNDLRAATEETVHLQTHVRLLSAWKEDQLRQAERDQRRHAQEHSPENGQLPQQHRQHLVSPTPPRGQPLSGKTGSSAPSAHVSAEERDDSHTPERQESRQRESDDEHMVTIRRSPTPHRPAPEPPTSLASSSPSTPTPSALLARDRNITENPRPGELTHRGPRDDENTTQMGITAAPDMASADRRCTELLRALLDKERQLATIAAERTHYKKLVELGSRQV